MHYKKISIASDHAGFVAKEQIKEFLKLKYPHIELIDHGAFSEESVDYPDIAHALAYAIINNETDIGIILCGSGNGVCISVNKHSKIRAALCWDKNIAELARLHNDANVLCLSARFIDIDNNIQMVDVFLNTAFEGGRHQKRVEKIAQ